MLMIFLPILDDGEESNNPAYTASTSTTIPHEATSGESKHKCSHVDHPHNNTNPQKNEG